MPDKLKFCNAHLAFSNSHTIEKRIDHILVAILLRKALLFFCFGGKFF